MIRNSFFLAVFLISTCAHAQQEKVKVPKISVMDAAEFSRKNPSSINLGTSESTWSARESDGTRGGGDSRLSGVMTSVDLVQDARASLINRFSHRDWVKVTSPSDQAEVRAMLLKNPMKILGSIKVIFAEKCAGGEGKGVAVFSSDLSQICFTAYPRDENSWSSYEEATYYAVAWNEALKQIIGEKFASIHLERVEDDRAGSLTQKVELKFFLSVPDVLGSATECSQIFDDRPPQAHAVSSLKIREVRRHPDGTLIAKTEDGYEICR